MKKRKSIDVLADNDYHTGAELQQRQDDNIETYTAFKGQPSVKELQKEFLSTQFICESD